jgi:PTH1 family peptidyl-tRNA hydrolase
MFIIFGLGNPGQKYHNNRHNIGFLFIDYLFNKYSNNISFKSKYSSFFDKIQINGIDVVLVKPQTYMNNSGSSATAFKSFFKVELNNIFVVHDEIDLKFDQVKLKNSGGNAGHNGLKDITSKIGNEYWRIRIGVDHPRNLGLSQQVSNYVLEDFKISEQENFQEIFKRSEDLLLQKIFELRS